MFMDVEGWSIMKIGTALEIVIKEALVQSGALTSNSVVPLLAAHCSVCTTVSLVALDDSKLSIYTHLYHGFRITEPRPHFDQHYV